MASQPDSSVYSSESPPSTESPVHGLSDVSFQLSGFNRSVSSIISSLASAPGLKDLPQDVEQINVDLAKFGSRLTEVESKMLKPDLNAADRVMLAQRSKKQQKCTRRFFVSGSTAQRQRDLAALTTRLGLLGLATATSGDSDRGSVKATIGIHERGIGRRKRHPEEFAFVLS